MGLEVARFPVVNEERHTLKQSDLDDTCSRLLDPDVQIVVAWRDVADSLTVILSILSDNFVIKSAIRGLRLLEQEHEGDQWLEAQLMMKR